MPQSYFLFTYYLSKSIIADVVKKSKCFYYFYCPHPLVYFYHKFTNRDFRYLSKNEIHFQPLTMEQIHKIYQKSRCILDVEHPKQTGATTRPIEMLPMKKKVITTNRKIKDFPFYRAENFHLINRDSVEIDPAFFDLDYVSVPEDLVSQYSPQSFARSLMEKNISTNKEIHE